MTERHYQQTVESACRTDTGEVLLASDLLALSEEEFTLIRRLSMESRVRLRADPASTPAFTCSFCRTPVWLSRRADRRGGGPGNRFYKHAAAAECPWYDPSRYTAEEIMALRFHGQREGRRHQEMKAFLARMLELEPAVQEILVEKVQLGQVLKGEWKKPDVRCRFAARRVVFELQLSYTFISEVVKRDLFYRAERSFIIWIFAAPDPGRAMVLDETYFNKRNLFLLDADAMAESNRLGRLRLKCLHDVPQYRPSERTVVDEQRAHFVGLEDLTYPEDTYRPFYFDYDAAIRAARQQHDEQDLARQRRVASMLSAVRQTLHEASPDPGAGTRRNKLPLPSDSERAFVSAIMDLGRASDSPIPADARIRAAAHAMIPALRSHAVEALEHPYFHAMVRLIAVASGTPLMTKFSGVHEVVSAVLQISASAQRRFAVLYCATWSAYQPQLELDQLAAHCERVQAALDAGDVEFHPPPGFTKLMTWLLARLEPTLSHWRLPHRRGWIAASRIDRAQVKAVGQQYLAWTDSTDWRGIYRLAYGHLLAGADVLQSVRAIETKISAPFGAVERFLTDCGLIVTRRSP